MSFSTTENMELKLVVESSAMKHRTNRQRTYDVILQTSSPNSVPVFVATAGSLTFGELMEVMAAMNLSRDGNGVTIPYLDRVVEPS